MAEAHLNGGVNLASAEEVMRTVAEVLGGAVKRIPDGETGPERNNWIGTVVPALEATPQLVAVERRDPYVPFPLVFRVREGFSTDEIEVARLPYAAVARSSYEIFRRLRDEEGVIEPGTRFQVSLPTPIAVAAPLVALEDQVAFEPAYSRRLRQEVEEILAHVRHADLAVQWDVAVEFGILEGIHGFPSTFENPLEDSVRRLGELSSWVPPDIQLGYHLCYGDAPDPARGGHGRHFKEPQDATKLVAVANAVTAAAARPLDFFSMPVPIERDDDAYYEPLRDLRLGGARLYLGLVHYQDGVEGTQRRIDAAKRHTDDFGVSTECGMARRPREVIPALLRIHRDVTV